MRRLLLCCVVTVVVVLAAIAYVRSRPSSALSLAVPSAKAVSSSAASSSGTLPTAEGKVLAAVAPATPAKAFLSPELTHDAVYQTPREYDGARFASSLAETDINGWLSADAQGNLILLPAVRDFFDHFLNAVGEVSPEQAATEITRLAQAHLPKAAVDQTIKLLAGYIGYKAAALQLMQMPAQAKDQQSYVQALEATYLQLMQLRRSHMSEEAVRALFELEEQYSRYTFDYLKIQADGNLSDEQKAVLIAQRRALLPDAMRKTEEQAEVESRQAAEVYAAIERAADEHEVRAVLTGYAYTPGQIEEVVRAFREQQTFNEKYQDYAAEQLRLASSNLGTDEQARQLALVRDRLFVTEQERVMAQLKDMNERADSTPAMPAN